MRIALASDHAGYQLKEYLKPVLVELGHSFIDFGTDSEKSCDYPDFAFPAAESLSKGECHRAILLCATGVGMSLCANRVKGVRAALVSSEYVAELSRQHNDANALCLPARLISEQRAVEIVKIWLNTEFEGGRHLRRINKITAYENR